MAEAIRERPKNKKKKKKKTDLYTSANSGFKSTEEEQSNNLEGQGNIREENNSRNEILEISGSNKSGEKCENNVSSASIERDSNSVNPIVESHDVSTSAINDTFQDKEHLTTTNLSSTAEVQITDTAEFSHEVDTELSAESTNLNDVEKVVCNNELVNTNVAMESPIPSAPPPSILVDSTTEEMIPVAQTHTNADVIEELTENQEKTENMLSARLKTVVVHKKVYAASSSLEKTCEVIKPFTKEELEHFYYNPELEQLEYFVDEFLKNASNIHHEFYDLLDQYFKSRKRLLAIQSKIKTLQKSVDQHRKDVWLVEQQLITAEGTCACGVFVQQQQKYQVATFKEEICQKLALDLSLLRQLVHESHQLESYNSQVSKIRVENYMYKLFSSYPALRNVSEDCPITASLPHHLDPNIIVVLRNLQDCISVSFAFKRRGSLEEMFDNDLSKWLDVLVSMLQRVGTLPDSFFLLNHLLRCPPGMVANLAKYIQFPSFDVHQLKPIWERPQLHHFVVMLATLTLPVKSRKEFLSKFDIHSKSSTFLRNISWTLVDEDKEEDENLTDSWILISEQDLLSIFEQFPFNELLAALLNIEKSDEMYSHSPSLTTSNDIMKLFAFTSQMVNLLGHIFETYDLLRYRQFIKQVSRIIRLITQVVADHWLSYRSYRLDIIGDSYKELPNSPTANVPKFSLERLQMEFDSFFLCAAHTILSSHSSGAIQFLSTLPFESVSLPSMWVVLRCVLDTKSEMTLLTVNDPKELPCIRSLEVSPGEGIFLLTALSNMAISRDLTNEDSTKEQEFVETVAILILEVSFINSSLSDLYSKNGHDLLSSIAYHHPVTISILLQHANKLKKQLQKVLSYIFEGMPIHLWTPTPNDLDLLRSYLMDHFVTSEENILARWLLSRLDYGYDLVEMKLFLPHSYHFLVAILLVESYGITFPDYAGGIQKLNYIAIGYIEQVSKLAISSYNKIMYSQVHNEFLTWAIDVMLKLKLHETDIPTYYSRNDELPITDEQFEASVTWSYKTLYQLQNRNAYSLDVNKSAVFINVQLALQTNGILAAYAAFAMTQHGHFVDLFLSEGIRYLSILQASTQYDAVMRVLSDILPMFINCPEKLNIDSFWKLLSTLIHIDVDKAGYTDKLWQYFVAGTYSQKFAALVVSSVVNAKRDSLPLAHQYIKFWLFLFFNLPMWFRDCGILYQIDNLCKVAFTVPDGLDLVVETMYQKYQTYVKSQEPKGLLSSVMSWISANQSISLLLNVTSDFCYYAYVVLTIEMKYEEEIGLWKELTMELVMNGSTTVEQAFKKASSNIKSLYIPPMNMLSIYRWGEQALATPNDHPCLPLIWQNFFTMFLKKPTEETGLPSRVGVGMRFFQSFSAVTFVKKMKTMLTSISSYHLQKSLAKDRSESLSSEMSTWSMTEKEHAYSESFHLTLSRLYQGLSLWLEESRLHDAKLYLRSLPEIYIPELLVRIFQGQKDLWYDYMDFETMDKELETLSLLWLHCVTKPSSKKVEQNSGGLSVQVTAGQRITKRLNDENKPQPAVPVVHPEPPVAEITFNILLTRPKLVQDVGQDLELIVLYAKNASTVCASHVGLDEEFIEMIPDLYEMVARTMSVWIPCDGRKNRKKRICLGSAHVNISFRELRLRERTNEYLRDNRDAFNQLLNNYTGNVPISISLSVVHIENIIEKLSEGYDTLNNLQQQEIQDSARRLFYLLAQLIDDDIKRCPAAIQFFSTAVESLGKKFIADNSTEQMPLLDAILAHNSSVVFLAPHFSPIVSVENYVSLYSKIIAFMDGGNETTLFVLLSKFDMNGWVNCNPSLADQTAMVALVMMALNKIGIEPTSEGYVLLEVIRHHMIILLSNNINEFYSKVLMEILNGSSLSKISVFSWEDLNFCLGFEKRVSPRIHSKSVLMICHIKESIHFLASYFKNMVDKLQHDLDSLYEIWQGYMKPLNKFLSGLFEVLILNEVQRVNVYNRDQSLCELWESIISVYQPWIVPRVPGSVWTLLRIEPVLSMLQSFVENIRLLISAYHPEEDYCKVLNYLWCFYYRFIATGIKEEQSLDLFHSLFTTLPWHQFCPTVEELSFVSQSHEKYPLSFKFFGCLLSNIEWKSVVESYLAKENNETIGQLHQQLLRIFVMMAANKTVLDTSSSKLMYLFTEAKTFRWSTLGLEDTSHACKWYAENADPSLILDKASAAWSTLDLFLQVCGYYGDNEIADEVAIVKRDIYVQVVVTLLTRCSLCKNRTFECQFVMKKLFQSIESTIAFNSVDPMRELIMHISTSLNILNSITSGPVFDALNSSIETYLLNTRCSMLVLAMISASTRSLASIEHMVSLLETAIACYFVRLSDDELKNSWIPILNSVVVPELNKEDFIKEALKQKAVLALYSYNLHRIPYAESQTEQLNILVDAVQWCSQIQVDKTCESKVLLLWLQIFDLVRMQIPQFIYQNQIQHLAQFMLYLAQACQQVGEDKTYAGVLGAFGIGRRSQLSKEFRIISKTLHLFILCQLPASGVVLRTSVDSPGAIRNSTNSHPTNEAEKFFTMYEGFLKNKLYSTMKEDIKWFLDFVRNPQVNISDGCVVVAYFCKRFFEKENFIAATVV